MESPQQPQGPQSPQSPPPGAPPQQYGGPVPPGGWQQAPQPVVSGQLAGWGSRLGAWIIDGLIVIVPSLIILAIIGGGLFATGDDGDGGFFALVGAAILTILVIVVVAFLYAPLLMMRQGANNGQTIGKQLLDIRAVRDNGQPWSFGSAALREVVMKNLAVGIASSIIPFIPWFLNYFWPLWDDQNRALHDMAVSSHVVKA
ncbi:MAG: RDD family protein [Thermoleophilaceae bacterium]